MAIDADRIFERSRGDLSQEERNRVLNNPDRKYIFDQCGRLTFMSDFFTQRWLKEWASKVAAMNVQRVQRVRKIIPWLDSLEEVIARERSMRLRIKAAVQDALETGDLSAFSELPLDLHVPTLDELTVPQEFKFASSTIVPRIYQSFKSFRAIWTGGEDEIRATWIQIPIEERRKILQPAQFPGMNRYHRLDFLSMIQDPAGQKATIPENQTAQEIPDMAVECPIISVEDLESGSLLLTLMESRATSPPHMFVWQDLDAIKVGLRLGSGNLPLMYEGGLSFPESENGENYGDLITHLEFLSLARHHPQYREVVEWYQNKEEKQSHYHALSTFLMPMPAAIGLAVLNVQDQLYRFLWLVSMEIQRFRTRNARSIDPVALEPQAENTLNENVQLDPLVRLFEESEYHSPRQVDMSAVLEFLAAKVEEKKSLILSLRENPGIFAAHIREARNHNAFEHVAVHGAANTPQATSASASSGGGSAASKARRRKGKGAQVQVNIAEDTLTSLIAEVIADYAIWNDLFSRFQRLDQLLVKYAPVLANINGSVGSFIPPELSDFTTSLLYSIRCHMYSFLLDFREAFASSVGFRDLFVRQALRKANDRPKINLKFTSWNRLKTLDPVVLMVDKLTYKPLGARKDEPGEDFFAGKGAVITAKEIRRRIIALESYKPEHVTQRLKKLISGMSAVGACWIQIFQYQPWARNIDYVTDVQNEYVFKKADPVTVKPADILKDVGEAFPMTKHQINIEDDFGGRTEDLFDAVQTPENTKDRQQSEEKLKKVWDAVQESLKKKPVYNQLIEDIFGPGVSTTRNWEDLPELDDPPLKIPLIEDDPYDDFSEGEGVSPNTRELLRLFRGPGYFESGIESPPDTSTEPGNDPTAGQSAGWWAGILSSLGKYVSSKPDPTQVARGSSLGSKPGSEPRQDVAVAGIKRPAEDLEEEEEEEEERGRDRPRGRRLDRGQPVRKKVKTRGIADPAKATEPVIPAKVTQAVRGQAAKRFPLSRRDCETMNYFFFQPSQTDHSGHIPWRDFVHAMTNIGFQVTADGGSVHTFRPPKDWNLLPINIHAPHGHDRTGKLRYKDARRIGTRLTNIYEMHPDQFVET